jgi:signal transduction histidine kinase
LIPVLVTAQKDPFVEMWSDKQIDSLQEEWKHTAGNDTMQMRIARSLGWYYQEIDRDSSFYFQSIQLKLARKLKLKLWEADALDQGGWILAQLKNYPLSLRYFISAFDILENQDCEKNIWSISLFSKDKDPEKARLTCLSSTYNDISQLYASTGNKAKEISYLSLGLKTAQHINNATMIALITLNIGSANLRNRQPDSALKYIRISREYMKISGYTTYEGEALKTLGDIYSVKRDFKQAKQFYDTSFTANMARNNKTGIAYTLIAHARYDTAIGNIASAFYSIREAKEKLKELNNYTELKQTYSFLHALHKKAGNRDSAYYYLQLYSTLNDSLTIAEKEKIDAYQNIGFNEQMEKQQQEKKRLQKENTIRTYTLLLGIAVFMLIAFLMYRNIRIRKKANQLLQAQKEEIEIQKKNLEETLIDLKSTQSQLIQSEKMASLGELTAGIAHEIQNPLNFVNNFSEVNKELLNEMNEEIEKGNFDEVKTLAKDVTDNEEKINFHGKRADAIVKGMLQHSRSSSGQKVPTNINSLADEYLRLAYHGLRAKDKSFNATLKTNFDETIGTIYIVPQDMGRVILNLITNAFYVVDEKAKSFKPNAESYVPTVSVSTKKLGDTILISVKDNGYGIPQKVLDKIFQPFFTTKPTGQGTGLGLSMSYDIIKAHGGELKVETKEGEFAEFIITLPV